VIGIRMGKGDQLVEMEVLSQKPDILTVSVNGYGKRTPISEYRLQGRGGSGIINMRTTKRNGQVIAAMEVTGEDQLLIITAEGKIIRMDVADISRIGRATQGVRLIQLGSDDQVVSAIRTAEREEEGKSAPVSVVPDEVDEGGGDEEQEEEEEEEEQGGQIEDEGQEE